VCGASGLYVWAVDLFAPGYFETLNLHIWIGVLLAVLCPIALAVHIRNSGSNLLRPLAAIGVVLVVTPIALLTVMEIPPVQIGLAKLLAGVDDSQGALVAFSALIAGLMLALSGLIALKLRAVRPPTRRVTSGALLTGALFLAIGTGLAAWLRRGDDRMAVMALHSLLGLAAVVLMASHFQFARRVLRHPQNLVAVLALVPLALLGWAVHYEAEHLHGIRYPADPDGGWTLAATDSTDGGLDIATLGGSESCGEAGCHEELTTQWRGSAHRFSVDNDFFAMVVNELVEERDVATAAMCARCHDPDRNLGRTIEEAYADGTPPPSEGIGCISCHAIVDVPVPAANGVYVTRQPRPYPGKPEERSRRIRLDPRFHRQNMTAGDLVTSPRLCGACHRRVLSPAAGRPQEIVLLDTYSPEFVHDGPEPNDEAAFPPSPTFCAECHMPTTTPQPRGTQNLYDHRFAGTNWELPLYARHSDSELPALEDVAATVRAVLTGRDGSGGLYPTPESLRDDDEAIAALLAAGEGLLALELDGTIDNETLGLEVRTTNYRIGHAYPAGSLDLREVWLEVIVRDADGRVLLHRGALGPDGEVDPEAARLGGRELDAAGDPIRHHRTLDIARTADLRVIEPGHTVVDRFAVELPPGTRRPLQVEAAWLQRRANPRFQRWVFGGELRLEPIELVRRSSTVFQ
jgi:hypothetical protein